MKVPQSNPSEPTHPVTVDFKKVKTVADVVAILEAMDPRFPEGVDLPKKLLADD